MRKTIQALVVSVAALVPLAALPLIGAASIKDAASPYADPIVFLFIGGFMLGLGRALGETMAVTFVIGNAHKITGSLLAPGTTISASIANEFTEADGALYTSSLIELGLILFGITFVVLAISRLMLMRIEQKKG